MDSINLQLSLPLHQTEADGPQDVHDHGDEELPLEGQVLGIEEGNGTAETLHKFENGKTSHWFLFKCSAKNWGDLQFNMFNS